MAKQKKSKQAAASAEPSSAATPSSKTRPSQLSTAPVSGKGALMAGQPDLAKASATSQPTAGTVTVKDAATTKVRPMDFHTFISDIEASPLPKSHHIGGTSEHRPVVALPDKETVEAEGKKKVSFAGLFSNNRKVTEDNKLSKFVLDDGALKLEDNDLIDVKAKLGFCLVGYIAGKFPGLKAIHSLAKSWGAAFQQHVSGWLIFHFARDEDRQRILAGGPYFVFGLPLLLKNIPDCFEFKQDDISFSPVWATLPSLPLECWNPNALGKIGSRLGNPIAMDALTRKMERVSYARILVEVDSSKPLVDTVEFILPNGITRKQPVMYEFTPKFCSDCNLFGHLKDTCQGTQPVTAGVAPVKPTDQEQVTKAANKEAKGQPEASQPQQGMTAPIPVQGMPIKQPVTESTGLFDSDDESSTATQHHVPTGQGINRVAPRDLKQKQKQGGDAPPHST
ncbi:hypothetical protein Salat_1421100 [Sesamum alatum]|uniref:DUF4283 domain-containing protein n=1 Tax=Sesamum alatum TaxID=300844 RepID=A0AAE1YAH4_9LAMI|nr:hypothetical protein Salat_1421100 [Sesamum alatum]